MTAKKPSAMECAGRRKNLRGGLSAAVSIFSDSMGIFSHLLRIFGRELIPAGLHDGGGRNALAVGEFNSLIANALQNY